MNQLQELRLTDTVDKGPIVIAGPCSAENELQVLNVARELSAMGVNIFRAGIWKPRTKPGCFEGVGAIGLRWLKKVKQQTGMNVAVEVATREHTRLAINAGVDILWLGARTTANPFAVQEIADTLREFKKDIPVLVKNPINPDIELWIGAMQRLRNAGVTRIGAIHRGFSVYGSKIYRNQPQWNIPIELHRRCPQLQIFHDPSHVGGRRELIAPLSQQALDMGFNGLIIECHCNPELALSDNEQQITPTHLAEVLSTLIIRTSENTSENLDALRRQIDVLDTELVELLAKRMSVCRQIGEYKKAQGMSVVQNNRYDLLLSSRIEQALQVGLDKDFMQKILETIHSESVRQQIEVLNQKCDSL